MRNPSHILITGASSGLGAALALHYAAPGILLSLQGRDAERLEQVATQARKAGATVECQIANVTNKTGMGRWLTECFAKQPIDLVIANAGISGGTSKGVEGPGQSEAIFAVNVGGVLNTVLPVVPLMTARGKGQIAIVSSLAAFRGFPGAPSYCGSKAAVRVFGEGLRGEMAPHGVEVNVICPGFVKTPMTDVNPFEMPFLMPPERASDIIAKGLAANKGRIAFPWQMYTAIRVIAALPQFLMDALAARLPKK